MKKILWYNIYGKLYKIQKRLGSSKKKYRERRHLQRLIVNSFYIKLIIIRRSLINSFFSTNKFIHNVSYDDHNYTHILNKISEYNFIRLNIIFLKKETYCKNFIFQIHQILWIFAFLPIHEKISGQISWQYRMNKTSLQMFDYLKLKMQQTKLEWICFFKFNIYLSKFIKLWLLRNCGIEKKFLLIFFHKNRYKIKKKEQVYLVLDPSISLKHLLKSFFFMMILNQLKKKIKNPFTYMNSICIIHINLIITINPYFFNFQLKEDIGKINKYYKGLNIKYLNSKKISKGFFLYGWFIQKKNNLIFQQIYEKNIRSHQYELKQFLKNAGNFTIDQVIYYLNQKIRMWKNIYLNKTCSPLLYKKLNNYLFWRIWHFLKKRHNNKGTKWILKKYYIKNQNGHWIFQVNQISLLSYNPPII